MTQSILTIAREGIRLAKAYHDSEFPTGDSIVAFSDHAGTHHGAICEALLTAVEALKRLEAAADPHLAEQDKAPHPLVGLTQPITVAEGQELIDAVLFARAALAKIEGT